jgi:hypothetical protein
LSPFSYKNKNYFFSENFFQRSAQLLNYNYNYSSCFIARPPSKNKKNIFFSENFFQRGAQLLTYNYSSLILSLSFFFR